MNKREKSYNIHGVVSFKIVDRSNFINRMFRNLNLEYKNFECEDVNNYDFIVYIGDFVPSKQGCAILDNEYYVKENYFYCRDSYKMAKWMLEISGFENGVMDVRISTNLFGSMVISGFIIDPLIAFKLNEKGYPVVHGSCVSKDNKAYLFTGQSGSGKTLTALYAVEKGFNFLGDDFVILNKNKVLSFLSPLNICIFNCAPIVRDNLGFKRKVEFYLKDLLRRVSGVILPTKINVKDIMSRSLNDKSKLKSIFLLIPKNKFNIAEMDKNELIEHSVSNLMLDYFPFIKYMMEYSYVFLGSRMAKYWTHYEKNLRKNLNDNITIYKVEVPKKYDIEIFKEIFKRIQNGTNA